MDKYNYFIPQDAISIELNVDGEPNFIKVALTQNATIQAYVRDVIPYADGNIQSWKLTARNTFFNTDSHKYVCILIPQSAENENTAAVNFSPALLDVCGNYISSDGKYVDADGNPVDSPVNAFGDAEKYWVIVIGCISEVTENTRTWETPVEFGMLGTKEQEENATWYLKPSQLMMTTTQGEMETVFDEQGFVKYDRIAANTIEAKSVTAYDENGVKISTFNGNNNGTITYYYPNGQVMREDAFVYDNNGNVTGMRTYYYNLDGSLKWCLKEDGETGKLNTYWRQFSFGFAEVDDVEDLSVLVESWGMDKYTPKYSTAYQEIPLSNRSPFSQFIDDTGLYEEVNGLLKKGTAESESIPLASDGYTGYVFQQTAPVCIGKDGTGKNVMGFNVDRYEAGFVKSSMVMAADGSLFPTDVTE